MISLVIALKVMIFIRLGHELSVKYQFPEYLHLK